MEKAESLEVYYSQEHPYKNGISLLRNLAFQTTAEETFKWNFPVYTINGKNVFGICRFKNHFGVWFFNGAFLTDPKNVLRNVQEGKTKGMRHWYFSSETDIDEEGVLAYMNEAITNEKKGIKISLEKKSVQITVPELLKDELIKNPTLEKTFKDLSLYKQREFCEYIAGAKQEKTKFRRLEKILPMIKQGIGLHDAYR